MGYSVHHIPGRIRFKVPGLVSDLAMAAALRRILESADGVMAVDLRPTASSVVVHYDPSRTDAARLADALGAKAEAARAAAPVRLDGTLNHLGKVFRQTAFKVALEQVVKGGISSLAGAVPARA